MKIIAIIIGKIVLLLGKFLHRGSSLPGKIALKIDKNILKKFKYPQTRIIVTGSSGKGSTSTLIAKVLRDKGYQVCHNTNGSNLSYGITTALIKYSSLTGKIKADYLVLEVDERYNKQVIKYINPNYLVLTNLTKDQPPRQHTIDNVFQDVISCIPASTKIITSMDEPLLRYLEYKLPNEVIYFSLAQNKYSYPTQIFENLNATYCPKCDSKLVYDYYNFEDLGAYHCSKCDFGYLKPQTLGQNLDLDAETLNIDDDTIAIGGDTLYHAYNTITAVALLKELNIPQIKESINKIYQNHPSSYFKNKSQSFRYFDCKSENATTFNQALFKIKEDTDLKDIIIGWSIISKRYPHTDISWLYDIEFELLNNKQVNKIYVCGMNKEDLKTRLLLGGIPEAKIVVVNDIPDTKDSILSGEASKVYCLSHYDYGAIFKKTFKED